jgi:hypothetical protein
MTTAITVLVISKLNFLIIVIEMTELAKIHLVARKYRDILAELVPLLGDPIIDLFEELIRVEDFTGIAFVLSKNKIYFPLKSVLIGYGGIATNIVNPTFFLYKPNEYSLTTDIDWKSEEEYCISCNRNMCFSSINLLHKGDLFIIFYNCAVELCIVMSEVPLICKNTDGKIYILHYNSSMIIPKPENFDFNRDGETLLRNLNVGLWFGRKYL